MEQKYQFPTEEVTLPSKGLLYPEGSPLRKGVIEMKYMTAKEEDILTNQNYIANGTVIDKLIKSLIVSKFDYNDLLIGDKNASADVSTRLKHVITSVEGDYEKSTVRKFVDDQLLAMDSRALRNYITEIQPDTNLVFKYEGKDGDFIDINIPINLNFFWPDATI